MFFLFYCFLGKPSITVVSSSLSLSDLINRLNFKLLIVPSEAFKSRS